MGRFIPKKKQDPLNTATEWCWQCMTPMNLHTIGQRRRCTRQAEAEDSSPQTGSLPEVIPDGT